MVDFQERDTKRGLARDGESAEEDDEGEAEIDEVREQLEERPPDADGAEGETSAEDGDATDWESAWADDGEQGREADSETDDRDADAEGDEEDDADADDEAGDEGVDGETDDEDEADDQDADGGAGHGEGDDDAGHHHADVETLGAAVVTISSSRTMDDDPSGDSIVSSLVGAGHDVVTRELITDDYNGIQHTVDTLVRRADVDVVVTTGGTGVTPDDETIEAVRPLFEKELPGFGELFRSLSYDDIGTRIVATRATAGVTDGVPVFCLPGSADAVRLGVDEIIVEVAPHLAGLAASDHQREQQQTLE